jgi:hypothetical protein
MLAVHTRTQEVLHDKKTYEMVHQQTSLTVMFLPLASFMTGKEISMVVHVHHHSFNMVLTPVFTFLICSCSTRTGHHVAAPAAKAQNREAAAAPTMLVNASFPPVTGLLSRTASVYSIALAVVAIPAIWVTARSLGMESLPALVGLAGSVRFTCDVFGKLLFPACFSILQPDGKGT